MGAALRDVVSARLLYCHAADLVVPSKRLREGGPGSAAPDRGGLRAVRVRGKRDRDAVEVKEARSLADLQ